MPPNMTNPLRDLQHLRLEKLFKQHHGCPNHGTPGAAWAVEDEKTKWAADHVLQINPDIQNWQLGVIRHFRSKLHLSVGPGGR